MTDLICFRMLDFESPAVPLSSMVEAIKTGKECPNLFVIDTQSFKVMPSVSFSYWLTPEALRLFSVNEPLESPGRKVKQGLGTGDDFRFVRCMWEVPIGSSRKWLPFAKGGEYSNFYAEHYLRVNWEEAGEEMRAFSGSTIRNDGYYLMPGVTWSDRTTKSFSVRAWPAGGVFSVKGSAGFFDNDNLYALGLMNSAVFDSLLMAMVGAADSAARSYQVGVIGSVPYVAPHKVTRDLVAALSLSGWASRRMSYILNETSNYFVAPYQSKPASVAASLQSRLRLLEESSIGVEMALNGINAATNEIYGMAPRISANKEAQRQCPLSLEEEDFPEVESLALEAFKILSYCVGVAFGRWNIEFAKDERRQLLPVNPFEALPETILGALDHRASRHDAVIVACPVEPQAGFTVKVRKVIEEVWEESAPKIEQELCHLLSEPSLDSYFRKANGFFASHLSMYSKSRRQAPIYWPISTKSGDFTLWVYYPNLDDQSLPKLIADVLSPKIRTLTQEIENRRATPGGKVAELESLCQELEEMRADFLDLINRGYRPNQNDGVLVTACPLAKYFRHAGFRKNLEACWKELARGDYDWAHLAMAMWPERALEACKKDRSIAIAHGREDLCPAEPTKATRGRKKNPPAP